MSRLFRRTEVQVSAIFAIAAILWLLASQILPLTVATGLVFVAIMTLVMFVILRAETRRVPAVEAPVAAPATPESASDARPFPFPATVLETIFDALVATDTDFRIISWNRAAEQIYGWSAPEVIGRQLQDVIPTRSESPRDLVNIRRQLRDTGSWQGESIQMRKDGSEICVFGSITLLENDDGSPQGYFTLVHDITERKRTAQILKHKYEEEIELQRYLKALHEITIELAQIDQSDAFYRRAVELGLERLSFDRFALFLYDPNDQAAVGTYGTDLQGRITDEHHLRIRPSPTSNFTQALHRVERLNFRENVPLFSNLEVVEHGWNAAAVLWNGKENLGWIVADNGIHHKPASKPLLDALSLYSLTIGTLLARTRTSDALRESEEKFRLLVEEAPQAVIISDDDGVISLVNAEAEKVFGYDRAELVGQSVELLVPAALRSQHERYRHSFGDGKRPHGVKPGLPALRKDGSIFPADIFLSAVKTRDSRLVMSFVQDITERMRAEQAIRDSESRYRLLAENISDVVMRTSPDDHYLYISPSCRTILGYEPEELIGHSIYEFVHPDDAQIIRIAQHRFIEGIAPPSSLTYRRRHKDGGYIWVETICQAIYSETTGEVLEFVASLRDVTVRKLAEGALQASEARFRLLAENIGDVVMRLTVAGSFSYVSPSARVVLGYEPQEMLGTLAASYIHPSDLSALQDGYRRLLDKDALPTIYTYRQRHKDGHYLWVEATGQPVQTSETGEVVEFVASLRDVTERKQAEEALRTSEARFRLLAENISDVVMRTTAKGEYTYVSPSSRRVLGYEQEELLGQSAFSFVHPDDLDRIADNYRTLVQTGSVPPLLSYRKRHKDGHYLWVETSGQPVYSETTGEILEFITSLRDVTERQRAEAALRTSEARFRSVIEAAPDYILLLDPLGIIRLANSTALRDSGYTQDEMIGHEITDFMTAESRQEFNDERLQLLQTGSDRRLKQLVRKDGSLLSMECSTSVIYSENGQPQSLIVVMHDISQHLRAEAALRRALEREKELGDLKTRFISVASHEFRTPLATILSSSELLATYRHRMDERQIEHKLTGMTEQVKYLTDIIEDVLDLARMQTKRTEFRPSELDFDALCRGVISEFQARTDVQHEIAYTCDHLPVTLVLDKRLIRQVINNLVSNAVKYSLPGTTISITIRHSDDQVILSVRDQGIGIPESDIKHLFEPFHRARNVGTIPGTGLGLSITKQAVEMHGGAIEIESQVGVGTSISICLPQQTTISES